MGVIFISHSSRNNEDAVAVRDWLRNEGYAETFLDLDLDPEHGLAPGERWQEELKKAGERCSAIVVVITPDWVASEWCQTEFLVAAQLGKKIFPIMLAPTPFERLRRELSAHYQIADASTAEKRSHGFERLGIGMRRAGLAANHFPWPPDDEPTRAPYRGLQALTEKDAAIFFGRDAQITAGLDSLRQMRAGSPKTILTIAAASGAGKSSFLKAGLLARLLRDTEDYLVLPTVRSGRDALTGDTGLLRALSLKDADIDDASLAAHLDGLRKGVVERLQTYAKAAGEAYEYPPPSLVLPIDQAEELFSANDNTGRAVMDLLARCIDLMPELLTVVTIRSDSLGALQADIRIARHLDLFNLPALPPSAFKEVIEAPGEVNSPPITFEPALTDRLIKDLDETDALPLLAFTLERLVADFGEDHRLNLDDYMKGLGGISGAINCAVDSAFEKAANDPALPAARHELDSIARRAFIPWMVQLDEADSVPRRRVAWLESLPDDSQPLVQHFVDERLLVKKQRRTSGSKSKDRSAATSVAVEVSHEAVLRHWRGLESWISEERFVLVRLQRVKRAAGEYAEAKRSGTDSAQDMLVHRGERLKLAETLIERADIARVLGHEGADYLQACRSRETAAAARRHAQERHQRFWRRLTSYLVIAAAALTIWGLLATLQGHRAVERSYSQLLTRESNTAFADEIIERAIRLSVLAAADTPLSPAARGSGFQLGRVARTFRVGAVLEGHIGNIVSAVFSPGDGRIVTASDDGTARVWRQDVSGIWVWDSLEGHTGELFSAVFSPDGTRIVTTSADETARVWRQDASGSWVSDAMEGHTDEVYSAAFSPDGARIVTVSADETARLWRQDVSGNWVWDALEGHSGEVVSVAFSPDGTRIVTTSADETARVWQRDGNDSWMSDALEGHNDQVYSAAFSPDGARIVTASFDGAARVWQQDGNDSWVSDTLEGHTDWVYSAAFSPDGARIVTASFDGTARVWRQDSSDSWGWDVLAGHTGELFSAAFSPDGARIVTTSADETARVWHHDGSGSGVSESLDEHSDRVYSAAFSPDGARIVTASFDGSARVWRQDASGSWVSDALEGHNDRVYSAAFSPDGARIVTASFDGTARIWRQDARRSWVSDALEGPKDRVYSAAFSPDGARIVTASFDGSARIWRQDVSGMWVWAALEGPTDRVYSAAFSPDGARIVTASFDGTARVWRQDASGSWGWDALEGHTGELFSAGFSPDGARIVTTSADETARVWRQDASGDWLSDALEGHTGWVYSAAFSPDGVRVVTASADETARVWRQDGSGSWVSGLLDGHAGEVVSVAFSPAGARILTASFDGTARLWHQDASGSWVSDALEGHTDRVYAAAFSKDGLQIVTASADATARVWRPRWLLPDDAREFASRLNPSFENVSIVDEVCERFLSHKLREKDDAGNERVRHPLAEISDADIQAAPILRSIGIQAGDNVCDVAKPGPFDALVGRVLPDAWWSDLEN